MFLSFKCVCGFPSSQFSQKRITSTFWTDWLVSFLPHYLVPLWVRFDSLVEESRVLSPIKASCFLPYHSVICSPSLWAWFTFLPSSFFIFIVAFRLLLGTSVGSPPPSEVLHDDLNAGRPCSCFPCVSSKMGKQGNLPASLLQIKPLQPLYFTLRILCLVISPSGFRGKLSECAWSYQWHFKSMVLFKNRSQSQKNPGFIIKWIRGQIIAGDHAQSVEN